MLTKHLAGFIFSLRRVIQHFLLQKLLLQLFAGTL